MESSGSIMAKLYGGPMDGDCVVLSPAGSCGPPQQLCYLSATSDQACWDVYETTLIESAQWPIPGKNVDITYSYTGKYTLGKGKRLDVAS